jgi:hypothetical protein
MSDATDVMGLIVKEELAQLAIKSFDELIKLAPHPTTHVARDGHKLGVTIYHDIIASGEHRIVVQVIKQGWLGSYRVHVNGFVLKSPNERRELTDDERYQFD